MKRPPIAWVFSKDTSFPPLDTTYHQEPKYRDNLILTGLHFAGWVFTEDCRIELDYNLNDDTRAVLLFRDGVHRRENSEAIKWLSDEMGTNFIEFILNKFLDLYEKNGLRCILDKEVIIYDKIIRLVGIDFGSRTILIKRWSSSGPVETYPIEEASQILEVSWDKVIRVFSVAVMISYHAEEIIREVNRIIKDSILIDIDFIPISIPSIREGKTYYPLRIATQNQDRVCIPLKIKNRDKYYFLGPCRIYSTKSARDMVLFHSLLEYVQISEGLIMREICYSPVEGKAFLMDLYTGIRIPVDLDRMQIVFDGIWIALRGAIFISSWTRWGSRVRVPFAKKKIKAMVEGVSERIATQP